MNQPQREEGKDENPIMQIYEHLTDLENSIQNKATKIGDKLINDEIKDEKKKQKKLEMNQQKQKQVKI